MEKPIGPAEPITRHHRVPPPPPRPFRHPPSEREGREERGREASERLGERDGEESDEETLIVAYVLGAIYRAELGLSGLGLLTEAGFLQITASENWTINRGSHLNFDCLDQFVLRDGFLDRLD